MQDEGGLDGRLGVRAARVLEAALEVGELDVLGRVDEAVLERALVATGGRRGEVVGAAADARGSVRYRCAKGAWQQ